MDFDIVLEQIRGWGFYQKRLWFSVIILMDSVIGQNMIIMMFNAQSPLPFCKDNHTVEDYTGKNYASFFMSNKTLLFNCSAYAQCKELIYPDDTNTIVSDFRLYCDNKNVIATIITMCQMSGVLFGAFFWGQMAEIYGRRKSLFFIYLLLTVSGLSSALSPNSIVYAILLFMVGFFSGGFWSVSFVAVQEVVGKRWRLFAAVVTGWPFGMMIFHLLAYLLMDWRKIVITINCVGLVFVVLFYYIEESPRWLLQHKRLEEAVIVLTKMARLNGRRCPDVTSMLRAIQRDTRIRREKKYSYHHLFRTPTLTKYILTLSFSWFTVSCVSYGLVYNVRNLPGNTYFNGFLLALLGALGVWSLLFWNNHFGRRVIHQTSIFLGGLSCLIVMLIKMMDKNGDYKMLITAFALLGHSLVGPTWSIVYLYSVEIFPTVIRNLSNGFCSVAARIGGISAPYLVYLYTWWQPFPYLIFASLALINTIVAFLFLPETRDMPLPDILPNREDKKQKKLVKFKEGSGLLPNPDAIIPLEIVPVEDEASIVFVKFARSDIELMDGPSNQTMSTVVDALAECDSDDNIIDRDDFELKSAEYELAEEIDS